MATTQELIQKATLRTRKDFLRFTAQEEKALLRAYKDTVNELTESINKYAKAGKVPPARIKILTENVNKEARILRQKQLRQIKSGMSKSVDYGLKTGIETVKDKVPKRFKVGIGTSYIDKAGNIRRYDPREELYGASQWAEINGNAMDFLVKYHPSGSTLSDRVWAGIRNSEKAIRERLKIAILKGESAQQLSRDIRGYLIQPETLRGNIKKMYHPGQGVYKSAYKNALRLTRTEYGRAYTEGTYRYCDKKNWIKGYYWRIGSGNPCPRCSDYAGTYFPKDYPPPIPQHPNCSCIAEPVINETKTGVKV